jgi:hypothetical protein
VCRFRPPATHFSVSPMEKTDAQILFARGGKVPTTDTGGFKAGSNLRPVSVIDPRRDQRQLSHQSSH